MLSVITPTRDRPSTLSLCHRWMARQTCPDVEWIIEDDTGSTDPGFTNAKNVLRGLERARGDVVMYLEDDDWFPPDYFDRLLASIGSADAVRPDLIGQYHVGERRWLEKRNRASFAVQGKAKFTLYRVVLDCARASDPYIDMRFWESAGDVEVAACDAFLVQLKGFPGMHITKKHEEFAGKSDPDGAKIREWCGTEADVIFHAYEEACSRST